MTKSGNFLKSRKFFGGGFLGRLKEKGGMMKEGFGLLSSAYVFMILWQEDKTTPKSRTWGVQEGKLTR